MAKKGDYYDLQKKGWFKGEPEMLGVVTKSSLRRLPGTVQSVTVASL